MNLIISISGKIESTGTAEALLQRIKRTLIGFEDLQISARTSENVGENPE